MNFKHENIVPAPRPDPECIAQFATQLATVRAIAQFGGSVGVAFLGDSLTQCWTWTGDTWPTVWRPRKSLNLGLGGDQTHHLLYRIVHGVLDDIRPDRVVQLIGVNDIWSKRADEVAAGIIACLSTVRRKLPNARVLSIGVLPVAPPSSDKNGMIAEINRLAEAPARELGCDFIDLRDAFLRGASAVDNALMPDGVHLSAAGYAILSQHVRDWADR